MFDYALVILEGREYDFSIYPNPISHAKFNVQTNFGIEESFQLLIYNNVGHVEARYTITDWLTTFESLSLQSGSYIFKLALAEGTLVKRVLVK